VDGQRKPAGQTLKADDEIARSRPGSSTPQDLRKHRCINFRLPSAGAVYKWEFEKGRCKIEVAVDGPRVFDDEQMVLDAALADMAPAYLIEDRVAMLLDAGSLSRVLEDWCRPFHGFFLYPGRRQVSPAFAAFIAALTTAILDRLMHRSVLVEFRGKSYRLKEVASRLVKGNDSKLTILTLLPPRLGEFDLATDGGS
jgi:LysR substrate binding domain/IstB-like ATP binding protein